MSVVSSLQHTEGRSSFPIFLISSSIFSVFTEESECEYEGAAHYCYVFQSGI